MNSTKRPLQAPRELPEPADVAFPVLASEKLDGIRCLVNVPGAASPLLSKQGRPLPNRKLYQHLPPVIELAQRLGLVLDGELWAAGLTLGQIAGKVMSAAAGPGPLALHCFDAVPVADWVAGTAPEFAQRIELAIALEPTPGLVPVLHVRVDDWRLVETMAALVWARGGEGLILRDPAGTYKHGRATLREANLFKIKRAA